MERYMVGFFHDQARGLVLMEVMGEEEACLVAQILSRDVMIDVVSVDHPNWKHPRKYRHGVRIDI